MKPRQIRLIVPDEHGCWIWTGCRNSSGYAVISRGPAGSAKQFVVHRLMYEAANGAVPEGLVCDHLCRVRHCVNPVHIEPVTVRENTVRGLSPQQLSAWYRSKTTCRNGHEYTAENTGFWANGTRKCLTCDRRPSLERAAR
jgi:hypothetical protein